VITAASSVYDYVSDQIAALIPRFNLAGWQPDILQVYREISQDSLGFPLGRRPSGTSRINHDGTPFQYAVTAGSDLHALQFIGEAGPVGAASQNISGTERLQLNRECIQAVAGRLQAGAALAKISPLLDGLAPATNVDLLADPGGAFWIGVGFCASQQPSMRIYTNVAWGREPDRWERLRDFAVAFEMGEAWQEIERQLKPEMKPLGTAITLSGQQPPSGRIYLTGYGKRAIYYEALAEQVGGSGSRELVEWFIHCMLGEDYAYPTQTAVSSFGLSNQAGFDFKFELCAHCLFNSDVQAERRLRLWFEKASMQADDYFVLLEVLADKALSDRQNELHCYMGVGLKGGHPYSTIYLKPSLVSAQT
jgi:hypothetical protein